MKGERESGHVGTREVGNVDPDTEITFQFGASDQSAEGELPQQNTNTTGGLNFSSPSALQASNGPLPSFSQRLPGH